MIKNWNQYKDLEYYPDRVCKCGCGGRIKVKSFHKYYGIPEYIHGHTGRKKDLQEIRVCASPGCDITFECRIISKRKYCRCGGHCKIGTKHSKKTIEKMRRLIISREIRICECGCEKTFECKINSKQKYIKGHHGRNKLLREIRICSYSGCDSVFECRMDSDRKYCSHECYWKDMVGSISSRKDKTYEEIYGEERAKEIKQRIHEVTSGENNGNWLGRIGNLPYAFEFNEEFKTLIRERDNNTCQLCGKTKEEEGRNLVVHHIYYDKMNKCINEFDFITLCNRCNIKVNYNREYWVKFFSEKNFEQIEFVI